MCSVKKKPLKHCKLQVKFKWREAEKGRERQTERHQTKKKKSEQKQNEISLVSLIIFFY